MTAEQQLMQKIKSECGDFIAAVVQNTPYPPALLAALTANESGGNAAASRFEPAVFGDLAHVVTAAKAGYGSIGRADLLAWCSLGVAPDQVPDGGPPLERRGFADALLALVNLATSWGPTQIMGYQALAGRYPLGDLPNLTRHFPHTVAMLSDFSSRFAIAVTGDAGAEQWAKLFRCWNTGRPDGQTKDPLYVSKGLDRMTVYSTL
jgi:hypothetical protein